MPQICDMGPMALLPLWRKARWGFFRPEKFRRLWPGSNPRTWVLKGSALPLDHRSRFPVVLGWRLDGLRNLSRCGVEEKKSLFSMGTEPWFWGYSACKLVRVATDRFIDFVQGKVFESNRITVFNYECRLLLTDEWWSTVLLQREGTEVWDPPWDLLRRDSSSKVQSKHQQCWPVVPLPHHHLPPH